MVNVTYPFLLTITKNKIQEYKVKDSKQAITGKILKIHLNVPAGNAYNAGIRIEFGDQQYFPNVTEGTIRYLTGDKTDVSFSPNFKVKEARIIFYGVNNDVLLDHSILIFIEVDLDG